MSQVFCGTISYAANNYQVGSSFYNTLAEAVAAVSSGGTITVYASNTDTSSVSINKNLTLNTNGQTITKNTYTVTIEEGVTLNIIGSGTITTATSINTITNNGTLNLTDATIENTSATYKPIYNESTGTITINSGIVSGKMWGIDSYGTVDVKGGTIKAESTIEADNVRALYGRADSTIIVSAGTITAKNSSTDLDSGASAIGGESKKIISGGTMTASGVTARGIDTFSSTGITTSLTISGSPTIIAKSNVSEGLAYAVKVQGLIDALITCKVTISGGTFTGTVQNGDDGIGIYITYNSDTTSITRGDIVGSKYGIRVRTGSGKLTYGSATEALNSSNLVAKGAKYGISAVDGFDFYNGAIKGTNKTPYDGTATKRSGDYEIITDGPSSSIYTSYLSIMRNYQVGSSYYVTLEEAIAGASSEDTIAVLKSNTDTSSVTFDKSLTLNTNGQTITKNTSGITVDSGITLNIIGSGKVTTAESINTITNSGTLNLSDATIENTSATYKPIYNASTGTLTINSGTVSGKAWGIDSYGTVNLKSGTVMAETILDNGSVRALYTRPNSNVTMSGGIVSSKNKSTVNTTGVGANGIGGLGNKIITGGTINVEASRANGIDFNSTTGGIAVLTISGDTQITATSTVSGGYAIAVRMDGEPDVYIECSVNISGGTFKGTAQTGDVGVGVYSSYNNSKVTITGGSFEGSLYGIYVRKDSGELTFGNSSEAISTIPSALGGTYGIYAPNVFHFYNGVIEGTEEIPYKGTPTPRTHYTVLTSENEDGTYSAYLGLDNPLVTTWKIPTDADTTLGSTGIAETTIFLPILINTSNSFIVDWGDGITETYDETVSFPTHTYTNTEETVYEIAIAGTVNSFGYNGIDVPSKSNTYSDYYTFTEYLTGLESWGEIGATKYGFANCVNLTGSIPEPTETSFENIMNFDYLFYNCMNLTEPVSTSIFDTAPAAATYNSTFAGCTGIESAEINVANIEDQMFYGANKLTDITIGSNVQTIGTDAFKATAPYNPMYLLNTNLNTTNEVALAYNWNQDNRGLGYGGEVQLIYDAEVTLSQEKYIYDGSPKEPVVTVLLSGEKLTEGEDYEVNYFNNVEIGTASAVVTGIRLYTGEAVANFNISSSKPGGDGIIVDLLGPTITNINVEVNETIIITADMIDYASMETAGDTPGSGVNEAQTRYAITLTNTEPEEESSSWQESNEFSLIDAGNVYVWIKAEDNVGNVSIAGTMATLKVGTPKITAKLGDFEGEKYSGDIVVSKSIAIELTSEDALNVYKYEWSTNSGDGFTSTNLITTKDGVGRILFYDNMIGTIYFRTVDLNNKYSDVSSIDIKIDKASPTGSIEIVPAYENEVGKFASTNKVNIKVTAEDNYSEASNMSIAIINEIDFDITKKNEEIEWIAYEEDKIWELTDGEGLRKVYILIKDEAGNQSMYLAE